MIKPEVIYQDSSLVVICKPAGLVVNRADTVSGETLQDWLESDPGWLKFRSVAGERSRQFVLRSGIVHRLDKDTSGVLVAAKSLSAYQDLVRQFAAREVEKVYLTLVHGILQPREGSLSLPVSRSRLNRKKFEVSALGKSAQTAWKVLRYYKTLEIEGMKSGGYGNFSLLEVRPKTGRTHQIRVHFKHLGFPVVGDARYTSKKRHREDSKWCRRQFLHAYQIKFRHPEQGKEISFRAELTNDLERVLSKLS